MPRRTPLLTSLIVAAAVAASAEPVASVTLPPSAVPQTSMPSAPEPPAAAAAGSFEQKLSQTRTDIRATQTRSETRGLSSELARLTDEVYHMGIAPQRLEDLGWKMSIVSRKTETALSRMQKLSESAAKDPAQETAEQDLLSNASNLLAELRRLEIATPRIQEQIGYAREDSRQFAQDVADAKQNAAKIADEAQLLLDLVK